MHQHRNLIIGLAIFILLSSGMVRVYAQNDWTGTPASEIEEKLTIPQNASVDELEAFIGDVARYAPSFFGEPSEYDAFLARRAAVLDEANDRILASENLSTGSKYAALQRRFQSSLQNSLNNPKATVKALRKIIEDFKDDEELKPICIEAQLAVFNVLVQSGEAINRETILETDWAFHEFYTKERLAVSRYHACRTAVAILENAMAAIAGDDDCDELFAELAKEYKFYIDTNIVPIPDFNNFFRRCKLPGKEMEFQTVTVNTKKLREEANNKEDFDVLAWVKDQSAEKLDIKSLEGKVVLVDCWATWCGPCMAEVPNMLEQYEKYHEKGFEIVGYSCDRDIETLLQFLIKEKTPWIIGSTVLSEKEGLRNYLRFYGVTGIPTMILIGRDGKVISIQARGQTLNRLLEEQFD